jgi:hypothetical protein
LSSLGDGAILTGMSNSLFIRWLALSALGLLGVAANAGAQTIYKCPLGSGFEYTDRPCAGNRGTLIHQPDDTETIDHLLDTGQQDVARRYATSHHVEALYKSRLEVYWRRMDAASQAQADDARSAAERDAAASRQQIADEQARQAQLQAENNLLRQQNAQYQDAQSQPANNYSPNYWSPGLPYRDHDRDHEHDHGETPTGPPIFHPCTQLAGGRVQC